MKRLIILFIAFPIILVLSSCSPKVLPGTYNGYVKYISTPAAGTVCVESTGFGSDKAESIKDGLSGVFYNLLFRGIPGSQYELPMVPNENEKKNDPVIKNLLNGGYNSFVTENITEDDVKKTRKADGVNGLLTINRITVNCDALRRHLEQNKVIHEFGY